ncbi:hypothetical protein Tco_0439853 [Tanacetum coccineum]
MILWMPNKNVDLETCAIVHQKANSDENHQESSLNDSALLLLHPFHGIIWPHHGKLMQNILQMLKQHVCIGLGTQTCRCQIMQSCIAFVNNIHVDYAELLWEGLYYSLHHPTSSIPYPRFTKIIVNHYMTIFPDISRRARDMYHNIYKDDDIMKNNFNSGRHKNKVGMKIPDWMITDEMKQTEHYRMYTEVFRIDVPLTQSQPTESTHGTHRTTSAPRSPNLDKEVAELSALRSIKLLFHLRLSERRSTRLTPPACRETGGGDYSGDPMVDFTNVIIPLKQVPEQVRNQVPVYVAEGLILERQKAKEETERLIAKAILQELDASVRNYMSGHILHVHLAQSQTSSVPEQQYQLTPAVRPRDQDILMMMHLAEGAKNAKRAEDIRMKNLIFGRDPYALDDDEIPTKQVSQDIMEEVSLTIYEAKLRKMADEMLRRRCTSGNEHQYHITSV